MFAYIIFVVSNMHNLVRQLSDCAWNIPLPVLLVVVLTMMAPVALARGIGSFAVTNIISTAGILVTLGYIFYVDTLIVGEFGSEEEDTESGSELVMDDKVNIWRWKTLPLFIGNCFYAYEGIPLVLPVQMTMRADLQGNKTFDRVLKKMILFITAFFALFGMMGYLAFREEVRPIILLNLSQGRELPPLAGGHITVSIIQIVYCISVLFTFPLTSFPVLQIWEKLLTSYAVVDVQNTASRAAARCFVVFVSGVVAYAGSQSIDHFLSILGVLCNIPLIVILPHVLSYKILGYHRRGDMLWILFGVTLLCVALAASLYSWMNDPDLPSRAVNCDNDTA